jgi:predicted nicotinamide N-methyase
MKKVLTLAAPAALVVALAAGLGSPAQANNGAKDNVDWCKANASSYGLSIGECVSKLETKDPVMFCKDLADFGGLEAFGYTSFGDCVSSNRH